MLFTNSSLKLFLSSHQFTFLKQLLFRRYKEYKQLYNRGSSTSVRQRDQAR